jgi:hypothetical protein
MAALELKDVVRRRHRCDRTLVRILHSPTRKSSSNTISILYLLEHLYSNQMIHLDQVLLFRLIGE